MEAAGTRVNLCTQLVLWDQELIVNDDTSYSRNASLSTLFLDFFCLFLLAEWHTFYSRFTEIDWALKYSNASMNIKSRIKSDPSLYELWYERPCPSSLDLSQCNGTGVLLRYFADLTFLFTNSQPELFVFFQLFF